MGILKTVSRLFTWWNGRTLNTQFFTWRMGVQVGKDGQGNIYYTDRARERRWVIYAGENDASVIPPAWHGWLHHSTNEIPTDVLAGLPAVANPTGSDAVWVPAGSILRKVPVVREDYEAWSPEAASKVQRA
ncbi:NADH-ubiquinone oxidoreductase [Ketogulonicigenium robustum]|uniref:NADH-ubiquinone oxidoreductase n=1 Tax=Ketogulonicigenium robustum TaxID=92947 RepID=A0A1W6P077_9RHOB|nr:NADH:ubiquinone oxidoreductase subunit NDUFA12 [Ketogulonicigenium robustum]ARO14811.1 NADH-ubiquinone oxidoreductase [Ketogulonicigenium robustum]